MWVHSRFNIFNVYVACEFLCFWKIKKYITQLMTLVIAYAAHMIFQGHCYTCETHPSLFYVNFWHLLLKAICESSNGDRQHNVQDIVLPPRGVPDHHQWHWQKGAVTFSALFKATLCIAQPVYPIFRVCPCFGLFWLFLIHWHVSWFAKKTLVLITQQLCLIGKNSSDCNDWKSLRVQRDSHSTVIV